MKITKTVEYPFVVVTTGSRSWADTYTVAGTLEALMHEHARDGGLIIRHGAASSGADAIVHFWCQGIRGGMWARLVTEQRRPAEWTALGKGAGFLRNAQMLREQPVPDLVVAFPVLCGRDFCRHYADGPHWTHGTKDTIERAERAGIPTLLVAAPSAR